MPEGQYIPAIAQGTTSTTALVLDNEGHIVGISRGHFGIDGIHPRPGWVEYSPSEMWQSVRETAVTAVDDAGLETEQIAAIGLASQGETVIAFDAGSGAPVGNAISWQDRRAEDLKSASTSSFRGATAASQLIIQSHQHQTIPKPLNDLLATSSTHLCLSRG